MYERIRDRLRPMTSMKSSANEQGSREQLREREKPWRENEMESAVRVGLLLLLLVVVKSQCPNGAGDVDAGLSSSASPYHYVSCGDSENC